MNATEWGAALDELQLAAVSESDRGWSGRGAEERIAAARKTILDELKRLAEFEWMYKDLCK